MSIYEKGSIGWLKEKAKEHGFEDNINQYIRWARENGELPKVTDIGRREHNKVAKNAGFKDINEYVRYNRHNKGIYFPISENEDCSAYLGVYIAEKILSAIFGKIKIMPYGNRGYDFVWLI